MKDIFKTKVDEFVDDGFAKIIAFVGHIFTDVFEQDNFLATFGQYREDVAVFFGNVQKGIIKNIGKLGFVLAFKQTRNKLVGL